ncbi:MAG: FtsH protease activity modulator HflK [Candidatus Wallbacteria bacterium]|nr:FtsH protease activity modulator HflK [Candidatus Wallbacteria bacterium]
MDFEDGKIVNEDWEKYRNKGWRFVRTNLMLLAAGALIVYLASGLFIVQQYELGVVRRFGRLNRTVGPGLHFHIPFPIEQVDKPKVAEMKRMEIGFMTVSYDGSARYRDIAEESLLLTGDINIISADFIVQYNIKDPAAYLFNVYNVTQTIKQAAEATMRQVSANHISDDILTEKKDIMQEEAKKLMQNLLDSYGAGVSIQSVKLQDVVPPDPVVGAFKDVASAKEDREKIINEAHGYQNQLLPKAKGDAAKLILESQGYKQEKINLARGEAEKFLKVREEYRKAPEITRIRLHIETMERVLPKVRKVIGAGDKGELLKLFHLNAGGVK